MTELEPVSDRPTEPAPTRDIRPTSLLKLVAVVAIGGVAALFAIQNSERVEVEFLTWSFRTPQVLVLIFSALIGILVWELVRAVLKRDRSRRS